MKTTKLRKVLEIRCISAAKLARLAKLSERTCQALARGDRKPTLDQAAKISKVLKEPVELLF